MKERSGQKELDSAIGEAIRLHGHLGPFLVVGTRMGLVAKYLLRAKAEEIMQLHATVRVAFAVPFSCAIDGIQATTHCTIGNQKLQVKNCKGSIRASFTRGDRGKVVEVGLRRKVFEDLKQRLAAKATNEELAEEILHMPENELFGVTTREPLPNQQNESAKSDLKTAKSLLIDENLTLCIVKRGKTLFESRSQGVESLLLAIQKLKRNLEGSSVADKVVGKAIALLCVHSNVGAVYAQIMSRCAKSMLEKSSIQLECATLVPNILNFEKTNLCPIERLVRNIQDPGYAYDKLASLQGAKRKTEPSQAR